VLAQVLAADVNIGYEEGFVNTQARPGSKRSGAECYDLTGRLN